MSGVDHGRRRLGEQRAVLGGGGLALAAETAPAARALWRRRRRRQEALDVGLPSARDARRGGHFGRRASLVSARALLGGSSSSWVRWRGGRARRRCSATSKDPRFVNLNRAKVYKEVPYSTGCPTSNSDSLLADVYLQDRKVYIFIFFIIQNTAMCIPAIAHDHRNTSDASPG